MNTPSEPRSSIASYIEHTLLLPDATLSDIERLCNEAMQFGFIAVCINPCFVRRSAEVLRASGVRVCTVIGSPLGCSTTETKVFEAERSLKDGADELDMMINLGNVKQGKRPGSDLRVADEIRSVVAAARRRNGTVKVILETGLLSDDEKVFACRAAASAGADFVKTSTSFLGPGATVDDVALLRATVGSTIGVKASGGIRNLVQARAMIAAGANRIGTSSGVTMVAEE